MSEFVINARKGAFAHTKVTVRSMATIGDVARKAGVSTTLVSRYLNGVKGVSPASKEKIESAIRELNYVPDESARMLVRRRGGGAPAELPQKPQTAPAVAMVCEDVDFQLISALYLGAKIALRADERCRATHLMLVCIPSGDDRDADEGDTLTYLSSICKGIYAVGVTAAMKERLATAGCPVVVVSSAADARTLYRSAQDLRDTLAALEQESGARILRLCGRIAAGDSTCTEETVSCQLIISDDPVPDRSPLGRSLQSHLL